VYGFDSFIIFMDNFLHRGYIYLIKEPLKALDKFKIFKAEVENQHDIKIKVVRSDGGGGGSAMVDIPRMAKFLDRFHGSYRKIA
jgi:hypothetical protein